MRQLILLLLCILVCIAGFGVATNHPPFDIEHVWLRVIVAIFAWFIASVFGLFAITGK